MLKPHSAFRTHLSKCWNHTLLVKSRRLCVKIVKSGKIPLVHFKTTLGFFVLCVKWYLACQNHTQRVANSIKIILWGSKSHFSCRNHTLRVVVTFKSVKFTLVHIKTTQSLSYSLLNDTLCFKLTLCVPKLYISCKDHTFACKNHIQRVVFTFLSV
jgi:hypothetical protein